MCHFVYLTVTKASFDNQTVRLEKTAAAEELLKMCELNWIAVVTFDSQRFTRDR